MNFYISNPDLDSKIKEIKLKIRLSMNGVVSEQMEKSGIIYKQNFGVSIPRLKELATGYQKNHDLAQRLWFLKIRETMILATLLQPLEKFTYETALNWINDFNQIEIIEQSTMNLLSKLSFSNSMVNECIQSHKNLTQITGFILAARTFQQFNDKEVAEITNRAFELSATDDLHLYKSIALCLCRFCRINKVTAQLILRKAEKLENINTHSHEYILSELKQEILFLEIL